MPDKRLERTRKSYEKAPDPDCFPTVGCRCCECQGKRCFVDHPGHWHGTPTIMEGSPGAKPKL